MFGVVFSLFAASDAIPRTPKVVTVIIPEGSSMESSERNNFEPAVIKVVIGVNNTVRWVNEDVLPSKIEVDADTADPEFWRVTNSAPLLLHGDIFEFTFTIPGEFDYYSVPHPHKRGTVIVSEPEG